MLSLLIPSNSTTRQLIRFVAVLLVLILFAADATAGCGERRPVRRVLGAVVRPAAVVRTRVSERTVLRPAAAAAPNCAIPARR